MTVPRGMGGISPLKSTTKQGLQQPFCITFGMGGKLGAMRPSLSRAASPVAVAAAADVALAGAAAAVADLLAGLVAGLLPLPSGCAHDGTS